MKSGHRIILLRTVNTDVVVFAVSLIQDGDEGEKAVWDTSLKVTNAFLNLASAPLMTLSQREICGTPGMTTPPDILIEILQKCRIPRRKTLSPGTVIGLSYLRESTLLVTMCCYTHGIILPPSHWWCLENDGQHFLKLPSPDIKLSIVGAKRL